MGAIRLSPAASVTPTADGVLLRSDLGTFRLDGPDVRLFVTTMLPLLDGTRDGSAIAEALPSYSRESVLSFLAMLEQHGLLEEVPSAPAGDDERWLGQAAFFRKWSEQPDELVARLRQARVLFVGLEPWGAVAATELAAGGVGTLHLLDAGTIGPDDLLAVRLWPDTARGMLRSRALASTLAATAPWCHVTTGDLLPSPDAPLSLDDPRWDLVVACTSGDDLLTLQSAARFAHQHGIVSLYGCLDGIEAVVGPAVVPGQSACWNCYRLRRLAHAAHPDEAHALQAAWLAGPSPRRDHMYLAPMAPLLGQLLALEAIQLLTRYAPSRLVGRVLVQHLVTLESSLHAVVRMPWCDVCGGAAAGGGQPGGPVPDAASGRSTSLADLRDPKEVREAFAGWVDEHVGVIRYAGVDLPAEVGPELPIGSTAVLAAYTEGTQTQTGPAPAVGSGKGLTAAESLLSAIGEAIERYSATRFRSGELRYATMDDLDGDALDPRRLCLYADDQYASPSFPFVPFAPDKPIHWVAGRWLDTGAPVWMPALPTFLHFPAPRDEQFCQVTSNGLAAGGDRDDAALRATFELIERDAFMLTWLAQLPARRVLLDEALDAGAGEVVRQLAEAGARIVLYLLDVDQAVPTLVCVGYGDGDRWPGATVSLAAHLDPRTAARKAILEQGHVGPYIRHLMRDGEHKVPDDPEQVRSLTDHALYYVPAERARAFDFLHDDGRTVCLSDLERPARVDLASCIGRLREAGLRVAVADVTAPDVATSPLRVMRAMGPDIQPIHFGHDFQRLANPRLAALLSRGLNAHPHPLA